MCSDVVWGGIEVVWGVSIPCCCKQWPHCKKTKFCLEIQCLTLNGNQ